MRENFYSVSLVFQHDTQLAIIGIMSYVAQDLWSENFKKHLEIADMENSISTASCAPFKLNHSEKNSTFY